jgi:hypothetical protein
MPRIVSALLLMAGAFLVSGCNRMYHLPGHNEENLRNPPDVTMEVGERRKAISTGLTLFVLVPVWMESSDPEIVKIELPDHDTAYLIARSPGVATVRYPDRYDGPDDPPNQGFKVHVIPKKPQG